jgi:hypothetical protein
MHLLELAFQAFFDDTKALVSDGVRKDVASRISQATSSIEKNNASKLGKQRLKCLKSWLESDQPLDYGNDDSQPTYNLLLQAISPSTQDVVLGLPNFQAHAMTPTDFADLLIKVSSPKNPSRPSAPVQTNGSFLPVLKLVHKHLITLSGSANSSAQHDFIQKFLLRTINLLHIRFVPSHKPLSNTSHSSAPYRMPLYDSWASLGLRDTNTPQLSLINQPSTSTSQHAATLALNDALATDCNSQWFIQHASLANLHTRLHKTSLPQDYQIPAKTHTKYVDDTYEWVRQSYNATKPLHHFALLVAIIASKLTPNLFLPKDHNQRPHFSSADTPDKVRALYNDMPWVAREGRKGMKDKKIFVAMFTTYIIALYESESPLRLYMKASPKSGLGDVWTSKHCMSSFFFTSFSLQLTLFSDNKGISYTTMIRLRAFWGIGVGALEKGMFNKHWGCHSNKHIDFLYNSLIQSLKQQSFGPFDALTILIGEKNARSFCITRLGLSARPNSNVTISQQYDTVDHMDVVSDLD